MNKFLIAVFMTALTGGSGAAQQPAPMPGADMKGMEMMMPAASDTASTKAYKGDMMKMMMAMPKFTGDADVDFMRQMRGHHQAAVDMAKVALAQGKDAEVKKLATDIVAAQEKEIATIDQWLKMKGM